MTLYQARKHAYQQLHAVLWTSASPYPQKLYQAGQAQLVAAKKLRPSIISRFAMFVREQQHLQVMRLQLLIVQKHTSASCEGASSRPAVAWNGGGVLPVLRKKTNAPAPLQPPDSDRSS